MSTDRDFDRISRAWLDLMPDEAPERVVANVLEAVESTPQMRRRSPAGMWRSACMTRQNFVRLALAALVVAVGLGAFLSRSPSVGAPAQPSSPSNSASNAPEASPAVSASPTPLRPYATTTFVSPFSADLSTEWDVAVDDSKGVFLSFRGSPDSGLQVVYLDNVATEPCQQKSSAVFPTTPWTSTPTEFISWLDRTFQPNREKFFGLGDSVVVGGADGRERTFPYFADTVLERGECKAVLVTMWQSDNSIVLTRESYAALHRVIALDVKGHTVVIFEWGASAAFRQASDRLLASLRFQ